MLVVYYVEGLKHNFLSIGKLLQKGYGVYIEDNHCVIKEEHPRNQLIAKVPMKKQSLVSFEDNSRHKRKDKYRSCIQGRKQGSRHALRQERK